MRFYDPMSTALQNLLKTNSKKRKPSPDVVPEPKRKLYLFMLICSECETEEMYMVNAEFLSEREKSDAAECVPNLGEEDDTLWCVPTDTCSPEDIRLAYALWHRCAHEENAEDAVSDAFEDDKLRTEPIPTLKFTQHGEVGVSGFDTVVTVPVILTSEWYDEE